MHTVRVNVIDALAVDPETIDARVLRYPKLARRIEELAPQIAEAKLHLEHDAADAFTAHHLKREIESFDLLCVAQKLQEARFLAEERVLASEFTKRSKHLFGEPDLATASHLATEALVEFRSWRGKIDDADLGIIERAYSQLIHDHKKVDPVDIEAAAISAAIKTELHNRYDYLFVLFDDGPELFTAHEAADIFERALVLLAEKDAAWAGWTVNRKPEAVIFSISAVRKQINVGLRRQSMTPDECKGVLAHEILVHAGRAVQGSKTDPMLGMGLPGYVAAEEGVAILMEAAMTGAIPRKIVDRYIDIALALAGTNRQQLFQIALARAKVRAAWFGTQLTAAELRLVTWAQTDRIYRGTKGDDAIGVFTKDLGYYSGFASIVAYVIRQQAGGTSTPAIIDFLLSGKFDPQNKLHLSFIGQRGLPAAPLV